MKNTCHVSCDLAAMRTAYLAFLQRLVMLVDLLIEGGSFDLSLDNQLDRYGGEVD